MRDWIRTHSASLASLAAWVLGGVTIVLAIMIVAAMAGICGQAADDEPVQDASPAVAVPAALLPLASMVTPAAAPPDRNTATCITTPMVLPDAAWALVQQQANAAGTSTQDIIAARLQAIDLDVQAATAYTRSHPAGRIAVPCWLIDEVEQRLHGAGQVVNPATVTRWLESGLVASVKIAPPTAALSGALSKAAVTDAIKAGGWPDALLAHALCITWHESSWIPTAHDINDPGRGSYGLFQIEAWWASDAVAASFGPRFDLTRAFEPVYNSTFAYRVYKSEGWHVWGTAHFCVGT